jgi:hypothetical protein
MAGTHTINHGCDFVVIITLNRTVDNVLLSVLNIYVDDLAILSFFRKNPQIGIDCAWYKTNVRSFSNIQWLLNV